MGYFGRRGGDVVAGGGDDGYKERMISGAKEPLNGGAAEIRCVDIMVDGVDGSNSAPRRMGIRENFETLDWDITE